MPPSDPIQILLTHDRWATGQIIQASRSLSDDQFHQSFEMGVGSLHNSINHILGAMKGWGDLLAGREQGARLEESNRTLDEMSEILQDLSAELMRLSIEKPNLAEECHGSRGGRSYSFTRGAIYTHVTTHGMHHRAQCLNMFRQLGLEKQPPSSIMEWYLMGAPEN